VEKKMILRLEWLKGSKRALIASYFDPEEGEKDYHIGVKGRLLLIWKAITEPRLVGIVYDKSRSLTQELCQGGKNKNETIFTRR
jgi:hypothetical protein